MAQVPADVLRIKKLSINRTMDAMGVRTAAAQVPEMDALLHLSPSVLQLREWIGEVGLKSAISEFRTPTEGSR
jgi:hypothetical protein